ncbi:MAG TPA: ABC transporter permease, partial [Vicinamibacterales bacterium]|nr:ABC transporter permease [Vicinamibacterales bacterium]
MTTEARDQRMPFLDALQQDARFAVRQLRRSPGFAVTAILTLALGMCASVAIYAFVDAALIAPLPYEAPSRLAAVFERTPVFDRSNLSYLDYLDWKRMNTVFSSLSAFQGTGMALNTPDGARRAAGARVSDDFFRTLGVSPTLGRDFTAGESSASAAPVVILSDAAWRRWFGGRSEALGQTITLDGVPRVIVGVMPASFQFAPAGPVEFWTPLYARSSCDKRRACHNLYGVARLADGVSMQDAAAGMQTIARQLEQQYPDSNRGQGSN